MRPQKPISIFLLLSSLLLVPISNLPQSVGAAQQDLSDVVAVQTLFGASAGGFGTTLSNFYSIDPATGAATLIGPIGFRAVSGMDFHPFTGVLYATGRRVGGPLVLITINTATGAGTEVGPLGGVGFNVQDISFRNSDATLFAYREGRLYTINTATGVATLVGFVDLFFSGNALAFSPTDTLYHSNDRILSTLNQTTGAKTFVTALHFPTDLSVPRFGAMDFRPATAALSGALVTGGGSVVYLAAINTLTGDVTLIGQTAAHIDAIAWSSGPAPPVGFDICLQDELGGNILKINSATGDYQFTNCQGFTIGGTGTISIRGCLLTFQVSGPDRRILARVDTCLRNGTASVQYFPTGRDFGVLDRNISNNTCACPGT